MNNENDYEIMCANLYRRWHKNKEILDILKPRFKKTLNGYKIEYEIKKNSEDYKVIERWLKK